MVNITQNLKSIQRRVHNISYVYTKLPENYEEIEEKYRKTRDLLAIFKSNIEMLMNYEHGGKTSKMFKDGFHSVSSKFKENYFVVNSFYEQTAVVLRSMSKFDDSGKNISMKSADAFSAIGALKNTMNEKLENAIASLERFVTDSARIDMRRVEIKNVRYDLEKMYKSLEPTDPVIKENVEKFSKLTISALESMKSFISDEGTYQVLRDVMDAQTAFFKASYEASKGLN